jgi:hypothetical protein
MACHNITIINEFRSSGQMSGRVPYIALHSTAVFVYLTCPISETPKKEKEKEETKPPEGNRAPNRHAMHACMQLIGR